MIQAVERHEQTDRRQVELSVIGSMALDPAAADHATAELDGSEFADIGCRLMFKAVAAMVAAGVPVDAVTLVDELVRRGELADAGGAVAVADALLAVPHAEHVAYYCRQLQELHRRDRLRLLAERLQHRAADPTESPDALIGSIVDELETLRAGTVQAAGLVTAAEALEAMDARANESEVIPTGIGGLDRLLRGGLRPGQVVVIGGRPGSGKSALMQQFIQHAAAEGWPGLVVSLEMTPGELAERAVASIGRDGFRGLPVAFADCSELSKLVALIRLARRQTRIELVAVDYLQLLNSPIGRNELRERQVATMSRTLKRLAMELRLPVLLGSQLNRESEKRGRPSLADLRESGAIEQDADIVVLIAGDAEADQRELIVAKHRGGPCGIVPADFDKRRMTFRDSLPDWSR
jgi:replicative DNA helicase